MCVCGIMRCVCIVDMACMYGKSCVCVCVWLIGCVCMVGRVCIYGKSVAHAWSIWCVCVL